MAEGADTIELTGHRGHGTDKYNRNDPEAPHENTTDSFRKAFSGGADYVETDPRIVEDGQIVLYHDWGYEGRSLSEYSLHEIQQTAPHTQLLTAILDDAFLSDRIGHFTFEIKKGTPESQHSLIDQIRSMVPGSSPLRWISFMIEPLEYIKRTRPHDYAVWIHTSTTGKNLGTQNRFRINTRQIERAQSIGIDEISGHALVMWAQPQAVEAIRTAGMRASAGQVNTPSGVHHLVNRGITGIYSNNPTIVAPTIDEIRKASRSRV
jgi:glycerophosphoryl diester phosphodiesterase